VETLEFIKVPVFVILIYGTLFALKKATGENEKFMRFVPLIAGSMGVALGLVAFFTIPDFVPASDWLAAALVGGASGLAATGADQVIKQFLKKESPATKEPPDDKPRE